MKGVIETVAGWVADGRPVALGRVMAVAGSAPRGPGAAMAVTDGLDVAGSVSGGCVESALVHTGEQVLASGLVAVARYTADDDGFSVGLTCGGELDVVVEPVAAWDPEVLPALDRALRAGEAVALATVASPGHPPAALLVTDDGHTVGSLGTPALDHRLGLGAADLLVDGTERAVRLAPGDELTRDAAGRCEVVIGAAAPDRAVGPTADGAPAPPDAEPAVFLQTWVPPPRLVIFGAVDFTAALVTMAKVLGFHVTVCDARPVFATTARFPEADEVVVDRPERLLAEVGPRLGSRDAVCVLTHDVKFDVPAIVAALATDVGYLGAMGSRRTHAERLVRLTEAGVDDNALHRLHSPIGLDLGGRTPAETAVSILAEVVAHRSGTVGATRSLRESDRPIHR